jgi:hypothetical protein
MWRMLSSSRAHTEQYPCRLSCQRPCWCRSAARSPSRSATGLDDADDIVQVSDGAGEPVNPGDYQHVTFPEEIERGPEFFPALRRGQYSAEA